MFDHDVLSQIWFVLLGVLLLGYAILDGFDFGVGIMHLLVSRNDRERRLTMNSIGPLWDGNEVWLVTFGGALFAAFPGAYATVFSGFYTALMLLLLMLVFRAVSMEFRSKFSFAGWRGFWDGAFTVTSFGAPLLFGVAAGNVMLGLTLNVEGDYTGSLLNLLNPYALVVGVFAVSVTMLHGVIYLYLKTEGELQRRCVTWMWRSFFFFLVLYVVTTVYTLFAVPRATANLDNYPLGWIVVALNVVVIANIPWAIHRGRPGYAFLSSCGAIAAFIFLFAVALYPYLVPATDPERSLTIFSVARSSEKTLSIMLIIAMIGMPFVLAYTTVIYWTFRGKVTLSDHSY